MYTIGCWSHVSRPTRHRHCLGCWSFHVSRPTFSPSIGCWRPTGVLLGHSCWHIYDISPLLFPTPHYLRFTSQHHRPFPGHLQSHKRLLWHIKQVIGQYLNNGSTAWHGSPHRGLSVRCDRFWGMHSASNDCYQMSMVAAWLQMPWCRQRLSQLHLARSSTPTLI